MSACRQEGNEISTTLSMFALINVRELGVWDFMYKVTQVLQAQFRFGNHSLRISAPG